MIGIIHERIIIHVVKELEKPLITNLSWSHDNQYLAYTFSSFDADADNDDMEVDVFECVFVLNTKNWKHDFLLEGNFEHVSFSPDDRYLGIGTRKGLIKIVELGSHKIITEFKTFGRGMRYGPYWSPDQKYIAIASYDDNVKIYDTRTYDHKVSLKGLTRQIHGLSWSPSGDFIAGCDTTGLLILWKTDSWEEFCRVKIKESTISMDWCKTKPIFSVRLNY